MSDDLKLRIREIEESARKVDKLALTLARVSEARKYAKEEWEEAVERHMELCRNWEDSAEVAERPLIKAVEGKADPVSADESWRDEPVEVLSVMGLDGDVVDALKDNGFHVLSDLVTWNQSHGGFLGIAGIGKAKSTMIADAFSRYWDARASDVQNADDDEEDDTDAMEDAEADGFAREAPVYPDAVAEEDAAEAAEEELERSIEAGERSGLDLVTSRPGSDPESNGVETTEKPKKPKRRRKAKV